MLRQLTIGGMVWLSLSGFMPWQETDSLQPEAQQCADLGFDPGSEAFDDCRVELRDIARRGAEESQYQAQYYAPQPVYYYGEEQPEYRHEGRYCPRPHGKHDHFLNEYGQDCKKTHRGWVLCK